MAVTVDQPRQDRLALRIDELCPARNRHRAARADFLNAPVLKNNHRVIDCRAAGAVDQCSADDGDGRRGSRVAVDHDLVAKLGSHAETARELAYRLYTLCERKKRAQEALSYNGLVQSWPEIVRLAGQQPEQVQKTLF